jgi:hypothetical protein
MSGQLHAPEALPREKATGHYCVEGLLRGSLSLVSTIFFYNSFY